MPDLVRMERAVRVTSIPRLESPSLRSTQTPTIVGVPIHKAIPTTRVPIHKAIPNTRTARPTLHIPAQTLPPTGTILQVVTVDTPGRAIPTLPTSSRSNTAISHTALSFTRGFATPTTSQSLADTTLSASRRVSEQISQPSASTTAPTRTAHDLRVVFGVVVAALVATAFIVFWVLWRFSGVLRRRAGIRRRQGPGASLHVRPYGSRAARVPPSAGRVEHALEKLRALGQGSKEMHSVDPVPSHGDGAAARDVERGQPNSSTSNDASNRLVNEIRELPQGDGHETGSAILLELEDAVRDAGLSVDVLLASLRRVNQRVEGAESEVGSALPPIYVHSEPAEVQ